ncbi:MAG: DUF2461 domain-containing protein [Bacteroidetes bacterium]|nr:DUF2461 domain-containing protein [Bacteroidota bacterium]
MLQQSTIKFLKDLKKNNNKPWFDSHRTQYENAKQDYANLIQSVIDRHSKTDKTIASLTAKDCMFRINRDVRFSKDKTPYKINFGASINRGGKKSIFGGYYFHCEPGGNSFVGGGLWVPMPPELKKVRQEIDYCFDEFKTIIGSKKYKKIYGDLYKEDDVSLVKVPQGFEKDNPAAEYIKLKSFISMKQLSDQDILSKNLVSQIAEAFETLQPLIEFINRAIG